MRAKCASLLVAGLGAWRIPVETASIPISVQVESKPMKSACIWSAANSPTC